VIDVTRSALFYSFPALLLGLVFPLATHAGPASKPRVAGRAARSRPPARRIADYTDCLEILPANERPSATARLAKRLRQHGRIDALLAPVDQLCGRAPRTARHPDEHRSNPVRGIGRLEPPATEGLATAAACALAEASDHHAAIKALVEQRRVTDRSALDTRERRAEALLGSLRDFARSHGALHGLLIGRFHPLPYATHAQNKHVFAIELDAPNAISPQMLYDAALYELAGLRSASALSKSWLAIAPDLPPPPGEARAGQMERELNLAVVRLMERTHQDLAAVHGALDSRHRTLMDSDPPPVRETLQAFDQAVMRLNTRRVMPQVHDFWGQLMLDVIHSPNKGPTHVAHSLDLVLDKATAASRLAADPTVLPSDAIDSHYRAEALLSATREGLAHALPLLQGARTSATNLLGVQKQRLDKALEQSAEQRAALERRVTDTLLARALQF
jgi:hypothetical protein